MKLATSIYGLAAFALTTSALAIGDDGAPIPGYGVVDITWEVETTPGGPTVELQGTVQQVHEQLLEINPHYEQEFNITYDSPALSSRSEDLSVGPLAKRQTNCNGFPFAQKDAIQSGINYLRGVPGQPANGPGPANCGRVSCSYNSAIWWCNDNPFTKTLTWNNIADSAQFTLNVCPVGGYGWDGLFTVELISGHNFNGGNWNTIIRDASC